MGKYTETPVTLYRIQTGSKVKLRDFDVQKKAGKKSFDLVTKNGLVYPATGDLFMGT